MSQVPAFLEAQASLNEHGQVLTRIYGDRLEEHNYGTVVRSVTFAGTVVGMVTFGGCCAASRIDHHLYDQGWLSDKVGRKFGMVCQKCSYDPNLSSDSFSPR